MMRFLGWVGVATLFSLQMLVYAVRQPPIMYGQGRGDEGIIYAAVAEQIQASQAIVGPAPYVYRLGGAWLAAEYASARAIPIHQAFRETNALLMGALLTLVYAAAFYVGGVAPAVVAASLCSLPWWSYTRLAWFCPVQIDLPWLVLACTALIAIARWPRTRPSGTRVAAFTLLCFAAPITCELGVLVPLLWAASRAWRRRACSSATPWVDEIMQAMLYSSMAILGLSATRVVATNSVPFAIGDALLATFQSNSPLHFGWSLLLAWGGPLIGLFFVDLKRTLRLLDRYAALVLYCCGVCVVALCGGANSIRFLAWTSPMVFVLMSPLACALLRRRNAARPWFVAALALGLATYLVMVHPFDGYYADYTAWLQWGGLQFSSLPSASYVIPCVAAFAAIVIAGRLTGQGPRIDSARAPSVGHRGQRS